jgi:hypothetical protein
MQHADGEILARAPRKKFGIPFTLSTMSICSIEDVAEGTDRHPFWFQLYVMRTAPSSKPDRPRQGGQLLGAGADAGPADPRPAPQGPEERPVARRPSPRWPTSST